MLRRSVTSFLMATTMGLALGSGAQAQSQSFVAEPIAIDIDLGITGADDDLVIVAAYEAPSASPRFGTRVGSGRDARDAQSGKPAPSIILGIVQAGEEARFGIEAVLPATVRTFGFAYGDLDARNALRESDPEMFQKLVAGGHVDPPSDEVEALAILELNHPAILQRRVGRADFTAADTLLKVVLQTELERMNCYRGGVDAAWGGGSRSSVTRYYNTLKPPQRGQDASATPELFRSILLNGDVSCPVPVAAAPAPRRTTTTTNRAQTPAAAPRQQPARQQPARQQPRQNTAPAPQIDIGTGVFN